MKRNSFQQNLIAPKNVKWDFEIWDFTFLKINERDIGMWGKPTLFHPTKSVEKNIYIYWNKINTYLINWERVLDISADHK